MVINIDEKLVKEDIRNVSCELSTTKWLVLSQVSRQHYKHYILESYWLFYLQWNMIWMFTQQTNHPCVVLTYELKYVWYLYYLVVLIWFNQVIKYNGHNNSVLSFCLLHNFFLLRVDFSTKIAILTVEIKLIF